MSESNVHRLPIAPPASAAPTLPTRAPEPPQIPVAPVAPLPSVAPIELDDLAELEMIPVVPPVGGEVGIKRLEREEMTGLDRGVSIDEILLQLLERGGSDLHLTVSSPPMIRVHGDLEPLQEFAPLTQTQVQELLYSMLTERQKKRFEEERELDFAYALPGAARFRVNIFQQRGNLGGVLRAIPWNIQPLEALAMPDVIGDFAHLPRGLVLVTGPTGSGKSTTLAAILDKANRTRKSHIVTIEDPIEFLHKHRLSVVNQREVGEDTKDFATALKHALRQDPDIILVGEMRDLETISTALTAAETGHLVFGTLHTSSAGSTIDRIVDVFPPTQQAQIRAQLAGSIQAVVCQTLCKTADGGGRVAATEVLIATPAVRNLIREGKLQSIPSALQTGTKFGMHTLNQNLAELVEAGRITYATAREKCSDAAELNQLLGMTDDAAD